ncbi:MAG: winged helix-turn-helix domain-containing protein [Deltaproteobacteria bacterium]
MGDRIRFDRFEVDLTAGQLYKRGVRVGLREQSFQVLASLLEHPGDVITREELKRRLWRDEVFVDFDNNLNTAIARLREALGDSAEHPRFIETLPKHGYRFLAEVTETAPPSGTAAVKRARLVVLPFLNLTGDFSQEYLSDAITDEIITQLAALAPERLAVIARTTAMHYKGTRKDVARIGSELHVDYVLEGGVSRAGERVGLSIQLIQVRDQMHVFAKKYEDELRNIFAMQRRIAESVAVRVPEITDKIGAAALGGRAARQPTRDMGAYNAYVRGRYLTEKGTTESVAQARRLYEEAIGRDPEFALAHMALAHLYSWLGYGGFMRPKDAFAAGITYALRAVEIDDSLAEAHAALAEYHKQLDYDWPSAEREMAKALALNRASPLVRFCNAVAILMPRGRLDEAVAEIEGALESDPLAGFTRTWLGVLHLCARNYDRAIDEARRLLELEPDSCWAHFVIGIAYRQKYAEELKSGRSKPDIAEQAISEHRKAHELVPGIDFFLGWLGLTLGVCGKKAQAREVLEGLKGQERYILPTTFAHIYLGLEETDAAFEWLDRAVEERDQMIMPILSYAHYDPIRQDPRFAPLLHKMKLA